MTQFYREYPALLSIGQPVVAQLPERSETSAKKPMAVTQNQHYGKTLAKVQQRVAQLPWAHNILLIQKTKNMETRLWYMQMAIEQGWSRNILALQIKSNAHARAANAMTNFEQTLPPMQSDLANNVLKDPYIFDFLTLDTKFREKELESALLHHLEKFLLELGAGFAFVGRQYHLDIGEDDFYIDLLFYHLKLRCYVAVELKRGKFLPEYAGKMNFYLNAADDLLRHPDDQPSIGLILCQEKNRIVAEYALREMNKPIGVSEYQLTRALPDELKSSLPTIEEIEAELEKGEKGD
jgi:predicted nuclease of restriction endonuclease-like (RecB) superfamily